MKQITTLKLKATLNNIPQAIDCVAKSAQEAGFDDKTLCQIQLAVDEACANVINHAYKDMAPGDMVISCHLDERHLVICIQDWGKSFDPEAIPEPNVNAPLEERTLGGLGLYLIKQVMDKVRFTFDPEQGNKLIMIKRLQVAE
jgi:serine/threonine-protein kinase RsbW